MIPALAEVWAASWRNLPPLRRLSNNVSPRLLPAADVNGKVDRRQQQRGAMVWMFVTFLIILWLLGWGYHVAGNLIHVLLVVALLLIIINFILGRRTV
jgi:hypothetical protein